MPQSLIARFVAIASAALALGLLIAVGVTLLQERGHEHEHHAPAALDKDVTGAALLGGPFALTDQTGKRVTDAEFRGRFMLVYFGYSFCPDICPADLTAMSQAIDRLGAEGEAVAPIFITIDPARDTVQRLAEYARAFHPKLVALTGTPDEIAQAAAAYRVYYEKGKDPELMNHSGIVYLMDREGRFLTHFSPGTSGEEMAEKIRSQMSESRNQNS